MHVAAIILAAGAGRRIGGDLAKSYLPIGGRPLVLRTLDRVFATKSLAQVVVVVAAGELARCRALLDGDSLLSNRPYQLVTGGATRQQSAHRGLQNIAPETEIVIIHDGARPFVSADLIDRCVASAAQKGAVVVGVPVRDTIKIVADDGLIRSSPDRSCLWEVQTPQVFRKELILAAHQQAERDQIEVTDDAMVVERLGAPVYVIEGERTNLKITLPEDIWLAEMMIREGRVP